MAQCLTNGGFENGNLNNWRFYFGGSYSSLNTLDKYDPKVGYGGIDYGNLGYQDPAYYKIIEKGFVNNDPETGVPIEYKGKYVVRLGSMHEYQKSQLLGYTFIVDNSNKILTFNWMAVFTDIGHPDNIKSYFKWYMVKGHGFSKNGLTNKEKNLYNKSHHTIKSNNTEYPITTSTYTYPGSDKKTGLFYTQWNCERYDLSDFVGEEVTIWFTTSDCDDRGCKCYAYIEGLCEPNNPIPQFQMNTLACQNSTSPIYMDAQGSQFEKSFFVEVVECDAYKNIIPGAKPVNKWFLSQQAGIIDIRSFYQIGTGLQFKCNSYYKVKLAVSNDCDPWEETDKLLYIDCAVADAGPDKYVCCLNNLGASIGGSPKPGYTYQWTSIPAGLTSTTTPVVVSPLENTTYILTAKKNSSGCVVSENVNVMVNNDFTGSIVLNNMPGNNVFNKCWDPNESYPVPIVCSPTLSVNANFYKCANRDQGRVMESAEWSAIKFANLKYLWNTGETTPAITLKPGIKDYSVTVSEGCNTHILTFHTELTYDYFNKSVSNLRFATQFGSSDKPYFRIYDDTYGATIGVGPAYHAYRYKLQIFDDQGKQIRCVEKSLPAVGYFANGDIMWDGKTDGEGQASVAWYEFRITIWNCTTSATGLKDPTFMMPYCSEYNKQTFWQWLRRIRTCKTSSIRSVSMSSGKILYSY